MKEHAYKEHAYVVGLIRLQRDGTNAEPPSFGIFSEQTPTTTGTCVTFVFLTVEGDSYADAAWMAERFMDADARFVRTGHGSRPSWCVATSEEFHNRIKARIASESA